MSTTIKCDQCDNDAIAFESTPMGCGYVCGECIDHDPGTDHNYLENY